MRVFEGLETLDPPFERSTVAIGTFDGVHIGHQAIIGAAVEDARRHARPAFVFTFDRHPYELLRPDHVPGYLTTPAQRTRLISALEPDGLVIARFDSSLAEMSHVEFVSDILRGRLGAESIVVGSNFNFGKGRKGDTDYLAAAGAQFGFTLHALEPVMVDGSPASSSRVRSRLRAGDVAEAEDVLGHAYWLAGKVVTGQRLGRTLGYPTANLAPSYRQVTPADGIYAVDVRLEDGRLLCGACSIGNRPTVEGAGRSIETYLFDFDEDIYGAEMELRFVRRLRAERKFASLEALKRQMAHDVELARTILLEARATEPLAATP